MSDCTLCDVSKAFHDLAVKERDAAWTEIRVLRLENEELRGLLANAEIPCIYCKLPKQNIKLCPRGFPGCGRMDDLLNSGLV